MCLRPHSLFLLISLTEFECWNSRELPNFEHFPDLPIKDNTRTKTNSNGINPEQSIKSGSYVLQQQQEQEMDSTINGLLVGSINWVAPLQGIE